MYCVAQFSSSADVNYNLVLGKVEVHAWVIHRRTVAVRIVSMSRCSYVEQCTFHSVHGAQLRCLMMIFVSAAWEI